MLEPMITPIYAGLIALIFVALSVQVIRARRHHRVSLGDNENPDLLRRVRGQANCAEYAPIGLLLLLMLELQSGASVLIHAVGLMLLAGRALHGFALSGTQQWILGRQWGMLLTFVALIIGAVANIGVALF